MCIVAIYLIKLLILGRGTSSRLTFFVEPGGGELGNSGVDVWKINVDTCLGDDFVFEEAEFDSDPRTKSEFHGQRNVGDVGLEWDWRD